MSDEGFLKNLINNQNAWMKVGLKQFDWAKKLQGTKCIVTRIKKSSKYSEVFGAIVTSTLQDDEDREEFPYVIIINMEDMLKLFQKSINSMDFMDNQDTLQLGDTISFSSNGQLFKFQITDIQTFSQQGGILNRYTIQGLVETNSTK